MDAHASLDSRSRGPAACMVVLAAILMTGCRTTRPDPAAEDAIDKALALDVPIVFRVEGGPTDEPAAGPTLTMLDATRRAVATDPRIQAALARVRVAMADADQARLLPNPVLDLVLRWGPGSPNVEVGLTQDLLRILQLPTLSSAADNRMRQAASDSVTVALDVVAEVQERYREVQAADELIPVLEGGIGLLRQMGDVARKRLEAGEGVRGDVTTLDAQRVELEVEIAAVRLRGRRERLHLARLVGEPSSNATWTLDAWKSPVAGAAAEALWIAAALHRRPEVRSVAWRLAALGDDYALTRLLQWEGLAAGVEVQKGDDVFAGPSVSTPLPIFDTGDARRSGVTAAQIEARHDLTLSKRQIVEEVRIAHHDLAALVANLERVRGELIPLQVARRDQAQQAYRAGQTDVTALYLAEQSLLATQARAIDIERQTTIALVRLHRAVGGPGVAEEIAK